MPVIGVAREMSDSPSGSMGRDSQRFTRRFVVQVSSYYDGPIVAIGAPGIPIINQPYIFPNESHLFAICRDRSAERIGNNQLIWKVECEYETADPEKNNQENPLLEIPEIRFSGDTTQEPATGEYDDDEDEPSGGFTNSAGELYNPPPMKDKAKQVLTITRNEVISTPHPAVAVLYTNAVNSDVFWGAAPGQVKCRPIEVSRQLKMIGETTPFIYLKTTYSFEFMFPDWDLRLLDAGSYYFGDVSMAVAKNKPRNFMSDQGHPYIGLLDGAGGPLGGVAANGKPNGPGSIDPVFLAPKKIYRRLPFASLNLPQAFPQV